MEITSLKLNTTYLTHNQPQEFDKLYRKYIKHSKYLQNYFEYYQKILWNIRFTFFIDCDELKMKNYNN